MHSGIRQSIVFPKIQELDSDIRQSMIVPAQGDTGENVLLLTLSQLFMSFRDKICQLRLASF